MSLGLGTVLASEHLVASLRGLSVPSDDVLRCAPLCMANLGAVRHAPLACEANLDLADAAEAQEELRSMEARAPGMCTLVDCTPIGCGRDPVALLQLARNCRRVQVVCSTGYPSEAHGLPGWVRTASDEEIARPMLRELSEGVEESRIRVGAITAAVSAPTPTPLELKLLRAAAIASRRSLAPVFVQLPALEQPADEAVAQTLAELEAAGASPGRVCLVLAGLSLAACARRPDALCAALSRGTFACICGLGMPDVWLPARRDVERGPVRLPHDGEIADTVRALLAAGHGSQLVLSTGVRLRLQRERYGGGGYGHCRDFFAPLLRAGGVDDEALRAMTERNAARLLCWWQPPPPAGRTMVRWTCEWCRASYDGPLHEHDRLPEDQRFLEKLGFRYCATECLAQHRLTGFQPHA